MLAHKLKEYMCFEVSAEPPLVEEASSFLCNNIAFMGSHSRKGIQSS